MDTNADSNAGKKKKGFFKKGASEKNKDARVDDRPRNIEELLSENSILKNQIKDSTFMQRYNEKMLLGIIKNNERLIARYLSLASENASEVKASIDEFKMNLFNMNEGLQQMNSAVNDLAASTTKQNDFCKLILNDIETVKGNNRLTFADIQNLNSSIKSLQENSNTLHELVNNVEDVADRLRYMSFNGKIQAASLEQLERKMKNIQQGAVAGFTVVASQMEGLSDGVSRLVDKQNSSTTRIINNIISSFELSRQVETLQHENLESVTDVAGLISKLYEELSTVASSSEELSATSEEFASSIEELYAAIESISMNITDFYNSLMREANLYRKVTGVAGEFKRIAEDSKTMHEAAQRMMIHIRGEFINPETGKSSIPMARLFATIPFRFLPVRYREKFYQEGVTDGSVYLCLMGSAGENSDWNDIARSRKRQAVLLPEKEEDFKLMPMLARNFSKMGIRYDAIVHPSNDQEQMTIEDYALEKKVQGSPYVPDQEFVKNYNLVSQIGIGGVFPSGSIFTCFLFFNEPVDDDFAGTFMIVPLALQMALNGFDVNKQYWNE